MQGRSNQVEVDRLYLKAAVRLATKGLYSVTRNNPRVGCLLVKRGRVVSRGFHKQDGGPHAEVEAIRQASRDLSGCVAYVSLEPCCTYGRTPPCCDALIDAGVSRVVVAELDPNPSVSGQGLERLSKAGIEVSVLELPETTLLNPGYRKRMEQGRPFIRIKVAISLDGRIATETGESQWITCTDARLDAHKLRARSGAIVSGIGTVLHDDPRFDVRLHSDSVTPPLRVIFDTHGRLPPNSRMLGRTGEVVVVCQDGVELPAKVGKWPYAHDRGNIEEVVARLAHEGVNEVLVEAGPQLTGSFLSTQLWDELVVYIAPKILGYKGLPMAEVTVEHLSDAIGGTIASVVQLGDDIRMVVKNKKGVRVESLR